jgi:Bacterial Ig-like domain (group 3)
MFMHTRKSNLRIRLAAGLAMATAFGFASAGAAAQSGFTAIDVTGAGTGARQGTAATAIDAAGDVAGIYFDKNSNEHAFVLPASGTVTPFDASGTGGSKIETIPIGFDANGDIAGLYLDANSRVHGFLRAASSGTITILDITGEDTGRMEGTFPVCINGSGVIAGNYSTTITTASGTNSFAHGWVREANGTVSTFDAEPLPSTYGSTNPGTYVISINASAEVAGFYIDGSGAEHGFLRNAGGSITIINPPNAGTGSEQGSLVTGIDAAGDAIGVYTDTNNAIHGFVRSASTGTITVIDAPGAGTATYQGTYPDAIDAAGDISGSFTDTNNVVHGFVLPAGGTITTYDAPGASASDARRVAQDPELKSKLRELGKSYGLPLKSRRSNSPLMKLRRLLAKVGAIPEEGGGLLNGSGANPSGTASYGNLILNGVNASGEIVGIFTDGDYVFHGYLRATNGTITSLNAPNAGTDAEQGTGSLAINASGMIAGTYADSNSVLHGFLYDSSTLAATTITLTPVPTPNPSVYQEPVTLTASITSSGGAPPNGESVTFMTGTASLGTAELASGSASLTTTALPVGADSITAVYAGDSDFSGSTSAAVSQTVNKASSSTALKSSLNPSTSGQSVTLTANISGQFSGAATGTVTFSNGSTSLGSASVSSNAATLTTTALPVGTDTITAVYSGDSNLTGSTSSALSQVVDAAPGFGAPSGTQPGSISIQPGATSGNTATISVVGTNGFSGTVNLSCAITPVAASDPPTCTLSPSSVTLSGTTAQTSTLTVSTTGATSAMNRPLWRPVGGTALAAVLMLLLPRRRRSWLAMIVLLAIAVCAGIAGCGGGGSKSSGNPGTTAGTYTVTVTGTAGSTTATITTVTLTVE